MTAPDQPVLEADALGVAFGATRVVDGVSLRLRPGERVGLIGASGSGKSMLALSLLDLLPQGAARTGRVTLSGTALDTPARAASARGRDIGLVFQEPMSALNPLMTAGAQIAEALACGRMHQASRTDRTREAADALARVGLAELAERYPHQLSGGQRQRVVLAIAMANAPDLLIADEPTTALDPVTQRLVLDLIVAEAKRAGAALLLISHDLHVIRHVCSRVLVMEAGLIVERLNTDRLPAATHPATRSLLTAFDKAPAPRTLPQAGETLVRFDAVSKVYRGRGFVRRRESRAVDDVSLVLRQGEHLALMGESGAGKTSLARLALKLDTPTAGAIERAAGMTMGAVFQDPYDSLDPRWPVRRSVAEPLRALGVLPGEAAPRVDRAFRDVGLDPASGTRRPHAFSGGQRQRIAIARALVTRPQLVVLDEPVTALDAHLRGDVLDLLDRLAREHGLTYLLVSHDLTTVRALGDRLAVMANGRVVEDGATADVLEAPRHAATQRLVSAAFG